MRIGELAQKSQVSRDTIRFYEREGLFVSQPSRQRTNDYREYQDDVVERLHMIGQARAVGFSIADLQKLFSHLDHLEFDPDGAERFLDEKVEELKTTMAQCRRLLKLLIRTKMVLNDCK